MRRLVNDIGGGAVQIVAGGWFHLAREPSVVRRDQISTVRAQLGVGVIRVVVGNLWKGIGLVFGAIFD